METIIHGNYRSSFTTSLLESKHPDITQRKIQVVGRKVIENALIIDEIPTNIHYWNLGVEQMSRVEIFPNINEIENTPFSISVKDIHWFNVSISGEQYINDVMHGIIEAEVFVKYSRKQFSNGPKRTTVNHFDNTFLEEIPDVEVYEVPDPRKTLIETSTNKGCLGSFKSGCLGLLGLLLLLALLAGLLKNCSNEDGNNNDKPRNSEDGSNQDTTKVRKTDHKTSLETISLPNVQFFSDSDQLLPSSKQDLDALANHLKENKQLQAHIVGHTDNVGETSKNQVLSLKRALAVKNYLIQNGVAASRLSAEGKGESMPRASNNSLEGRLMNRRVEVQLTEKK